MTDSKGLMRKQLRQAYENVNSDYTNCADACLIERLIGHDLYKKCKKIFLYASVGAEVDTRALIEIAYKQGKIVALPICLGNGVMDFYQYDGTLREGKYCIPEPTTGTVLYPDSSDVMIVPGLAFDKKGYRMGQGGGYYDRYLEKHRCITIGVCREMFFVENVPICWNDLPVDYVITETQSYQCRNGASEEAPFC